MISTGWPVRSRRAQRTSSVVPQGPPFSKQSALLQAAFRCGSQTYSFNYSSLALLCLCQMFTIKFYCGVEKVKIFFSRKFNRTVRLFFFLPSFCFFIKCQNNLVHHFLPMIPSSVSWPCHFFPSGIFGSGSQYCTRWIRLFPTLRSVKSMKLARK